MWHAQAIACLILFTFANVLSTLLAKMMASHFHKATHFHKMQEAIRKVGPPVTPRHMLCIDTAAAASSFLITPDMQGHCTFPWCICAMTMVVHHKFLKIKLCITLP